MNKIYFLFFGVFFSFCVKAQVINFPDVNFKNYLLTTTTAYDANSNSIVIDSNMNNEIEQEEVLVVSKLIISDSSISSLEGLSFFSNLKNFDLIGNGLITNLDLTDLQNLEYFLCSGNGILTSINCEGLISLKSIAVLDNMTLSQINTTGLIGLEDFEALNNTLFTEYNFNHLTSLQYLTCNTLVSFGIDGLQNLTEIWLICQAPSPNLFTSVSITNLPNLDIFQIQNTGVTELNLLNLPKLRVLWVSDNQLSDIDLSGLNMSSDFQEEKFFYGRNNFFTTLDFSGTNFTTKDIINNQLVYLNLKDSFPQDADNNFGIGNLQIQGNPNLQFICVNDEDEIEFQSVQIALNVYGYTNCVVNSYCSFVPGSEHFIVEGSTKLNIDNSDCDTNDLIFPQLKFSITNGTQSGTFLANQSGNYSLPFLAGEHTITPILENQPYFSVSPPSLTLNFPELTSPVTQNFCITPNGIHNDLEISLLNLDFARPGFDANYKVVFNNKGTTTQSGSVNFEFHEGDMDFVTSTPINSSQSDGVVTFNFSDLLPFERREILITMNINSPTETLPVEAGEYLYYFTRIQSSEIDETPVDNIAIMNQIVVNSFDPNDKVCLEGVVIGPEIIGQYAHYKIRFENTGTFPAENIVVKDLIDLTKFDLGTLIPTSSSHSFVTRIASDGKVEFIFENIQLPFDDANNDGYIAFKIKTLASLAIGDTFSNSANIYFDYNFPILTNTFTTFIDILRTTNFNSTDYVYFFPNPAKSVLNLELKENVSISSINIYNTLGQLVLVATNPSQSIDVSDLKTGSYFVKVISDKGTSNSQFIKE